MWDNMLYLDSNKIRKVFWWFYMLKLGKINREKKCKIIQKSTSTIQKSTSNTKVYLLTGGGLQLTDTLNSGAIIINIEDYNSKSMGIL